METVTTIAAVRAKIHAARSGGARIGFVPTMGNLHAGHLALVDTARQHADLVVASIFVNPLQFGPLEDLDAYPRTPDADRAALEDHGAALLFAPEVTEIYPEGTALQTRVSVPGLGDVLCGASRPGHFDGVATIVTKLFNVVGPDVALFGRKDFQQLTLIRRMVQDLAIPVTIIDVPTARAEDGLALSSRNQYLTPGERARAPALYRALERAAGRLVAGDNDHARIVADAREELLAGGFEPDYVEIRSRDSLGQPEPGEPELVVLAAARLGRTRLIDNLALTVNAGRTQP